MPRLSIIMPVYNSERYLADAIKSILAQSFTDLELLLIDDGSTDKSPEIITSFSDKRIKLLPNESNKGVVFSRNKGLQAASGEYIGMLDSDDVAMPDKFAHQVNFLDKNRQFAMIGSWVEWIGDKKVAVSSGWVLDAKPEKIPAIMLFNNYFLQSAVVYRAECLEGFTFEEGFEIGEDYLLWLQLAEKYKVWNLPEFLVQYRRRPDSLTGDPEKLRRFDSKVFRRWFEHIGLDISDHELELHLQLKYGLPIKNIEILYELGDWLEKILTFNEQAKIYDQKILIGVVFNRWLKACKLAKSRGFNTLLSFMKSGISRQYLSSLVKAK